MDKATYCYQLKPVFIMKIGECFKINSLWLQKAILYCEEKAPKTGVNIIGFFRPTNLSKVLKKEMYVPNKIGSKKIFQKHPKDFYLQSFH